MAHRSSPTSRLCLEKLVECQLPRPGVYRRSIRQYAVRVEQPRTSIARFTKVTPPQSQLH